MPYQPQPGSNGISAAFMSSCEACRYCARPRLHRATRRTVGPIRFALFGLYTLVTQMAASSVFLRFETAGYHLGSSYPWISLWLQERSPGRVVIAGTAAHAVAGSLSAVEPTRRSHILAHRTQLSGGVRGRARACAPPEGLGAHIGAEGRCAAVSCWRCNGHRPYDRWPSTAATRPQANQSAGAGERRAPNSHSSGTVGIRVVPVAPPSTGMMTPVIHRPEIDRPTD